MRRLALIIIAAIACGSCGVMLHTDGGVKVAAAVNISSQPPWGPAGYDHAPYYYFPDFNFYYDVDRAMFHYYSRGRWIATRQLPKVGYPRDLYKFYKVVIDTRDPWLYNSRHKRMYRRYKGIHTQPVLRDRPDRHTPPEHRRPVTPDRRHDTPPRDDRRHGTPRHRPDDTPAPSRNTVRNSRNNNTGAVRGAGNGSRSKATGAERKNDATAKRKAATSATTRTADKDRNKKTGTEEREGVRSSGSRSTGSRGR